MFAREWEEACRDAARRHEMRVDLQIVAGIALIGLVAVCVFLRL